MIPRCLMLEFLVAQNWREREPRGPRALRSSRSGIARGRCREGGMWRFLKPMIEPWKGAGRIICFLPAASGGAVPCLVLGESCKLHRLCTKRRSFARLVGFFLFQRRNCLPLVEAQRHTQPRVGIQKVQIAHSTFAHFGKLHKICPNAFPCPKNLSRSTIESKKRKNCTSSRVASS
jgi:hypothetical protein